MKPDEVISSVQNPRIKALAGLRRRGVAADGARILIDGVREISRARGAGLGIAELYYCPALLEAGDGGVGIEDLVGSEARRVEVSEAVFEKIRYGDRTGGVVAVAGRPRRALTDLRLGTMAMVAIVERVGKPGNLGAILRSADGAGVEAVLVADSAIDVYGPNVIRASVSTVFSVAVVETTAEEARRFVESKGMRIVAAHPEGERAYSEIDYRKPTAFVFGAEDRGLSDAWAGVERARVPMRGIADSLNVATSAALFFYEALRQRSGG